MGFIHLDSSSDHPYTFIHSSGKGTHGFTHYPESDNPFKLIDTNAEQLDYSDEIAKALSTVKKSFETLQKAIFDLYGVMKKTSENTDVEIEFGSIGNHPSGYGCLNEESIALLMVAMSLGCYKHIHFRSVKEGYEVIWNILVKLIEILGLDKQKSWNKLLHVHGMCGGITFPHDYSDSVTHTFRITALALKLMGQKNWMEFQESNDQDSHFLDDFGQVFIYDGKEETPAILPELE